MRYVQSVAFIGVASPLVNKRTSTPRNLHTLAGASVRPLTTHTERSHAKSDSCVPQSVHTVAGASVPMQNLARVPLEVFTH